MPQTVPQFIPLSLRARTRQTEQSLFIAGPGGQTYPLALADPRHMVQ
jgi:hypothetical protein